MATNQSSNVADLSDEQRRLLESVIGQPLRRDQVVHWAITTAGRQPTAEEKAAARAGWKARLQKFAGIETKRVSAKRNGTPQLTKPCKTCGRSAMNASRLRHKPDRPSGRRARGLRA